MYIHVHVQVHMYYVLYTSICHADRAGVCKGMTYGDLDLDLERDRVWEWGDGERDFFSSTTSLECSVWREQPQSGHLSPLKLNPKLNPVHLHVHVHVCVPASTQVRACGTPSQRSAQHVLYSKAHQSLDTIQQAAPHTHHPLPILMESIYVHVHVHVHVCTCT